VQLPQAAWSLACWPASPNLSWSWGVNAGQQRVRPVGHADSTSDALRHSMRRSQLWRTGCTLAASRRALLRPRWELRATSARCVDKMFT
jgi:hypothetical protein